MAKFYYKREATDTKFYKIIPQLQKLEIDKGKSKYN